MMLGSTLLIAASAPPNNVPVPAEKPAATTGKDKEQPKAPPAESKKGTEGAAKKEADETKSSEDEKPSDSDASQSSKFPKCELELKRRGAGFERIEPISDSDECRIDQPYRLKSVGNDIRLEEAATLTCDAALALTSWVQDSVVPNLKLAAPDKELKYISNASSYVCRKRNHASKGKISEHAKGNAFDIATLTFHDGSKLVMKPRAEDGTLEGALQRTITTSACLFFTTVLSPGSDATHQDHLHLDVLQRKNGYRYCR